MNLLRVPFLEAVEDATGGNPKLQTGDYQSVGRFPIVDQGQEFIAGYTDDESALCNRTGDVIVFGDHTKAFKFIDFDFVLGADGVKVLRPKSGFDARYLFHYFQTVRLPENLGYSRHFKYLKECVVPKPSIEEQKRVAAILDKADSLRRKRQQAIRLADDLLRAVFLEMFGDPVTNPKGLPKIALGKLIKLKSGEFLPASEMASDGSIPVYGGNGINGYHDEKMFDESQIVIGRVGAYCGAVHQTDAPCWVTDNALYVAEKSPDLHSDYLLFALRQANLNQYASQSGQPLVSGGRIYPVEILVPDMPTQDTFAQIIQRRGALSDSLVLSEMAVARLGKSLQSNFF